jgi:ABC-type Fe3+-hydroxamate transport system substrate-binding protein
MAKPAHRWETRRHLAVAIARPEDPAWDGDPRAERLELSFTDGTRGEVTAGLDRQRADAAALADPDLVHALQCWLVARGRRVLALEDATGRPVAVGPFELDALGADSVGPVTKVITLAPSNAELVAALGCFDRVIACEDSSDFPEEVARCERLGPDLGPDLDRVAALAPDLVVSSLTVPGMERVVTGLRARGVAQLVSAPRSFADMLGDLRRLGAALGVCARAEQVIAELERERDELERTRPSVPARVYLEWWPKPMFSPARECYSNELIALAGGVNVFGDRPGSSVEIDAAALREADPEVCFVSWCGVAEHKLDPTSVGKRAGLEQLQVVQNGRVYVLDERFSGRPGPRMLEAARRMRAGIVGR